jgi:hypothetical protein
MDRLPIDAGTVKTVVDALLQAFQKARTARLRANAERALSQAVRELLAANPNLNKADAAVAAAKAAGIISDRLFLVETMRSRVVKHAKKARKAAKRKTTARKTTTRRPATRAKSRRDK